MIAYDRRGFGMSSQPTQGYDYDTFASDLDRLMSVLDLREATLVGFSMGTGEVIRYLGRYGSDRVERAILIGALGPFLLKTDENPIGLDPGVFEAVKGQIVTDRFVHLTQFFENFYNLDVHGGTRVSRELVQAHWNVGARASAIGMLQCVDAWHTDFRADLPRIEVPSLIIHGEADRVLPFAVSAAPLHAALKNSMLIGIPGGPHNVCWTHSEEVNSAILSFLGKGAARRVA